MLILFYKSIGGVVGALRGKVNISVFAFAEIRPCIKRQDSHFEVARARYIGVRLYALFYLLKMQPGKRCLTEK